MIVSHEHKFVFVEVPHTGTHSVSSELCDYYGGEKILLKHSNISLFLSQASAPEKLYFRFATVRNPLDHLVTQYLKYKSNHKEQFTSPEKFIENGGHVTKERREKFNFVYNEQGSFEGFLTKYFNKIYNNWFLLGSNKFDFVMRFESLQEDYSKLWAKLDLPQERALPHVNPTKGKKEIDYRDFYPESSMNLVLKNFGPFMAKWGYELPRGYSYSEVPASSYMRFSSMDKSADFLATHMKLDPNAAAVSKVKSLVERVL